MVFGNTAVSQQKDQTMKASYGFLIIFAILMGLAPFFPEPHLVEKLRMLSKGELTRLIDIFDLLFHSAPLLLLIAKIIYDLKFKYRPAKKE